MPVSSKEISALSLEEFGSVLSAIANNEAKANLFRVMQTNVTYTIGDLYNSFINSQGRAAGWDINPTTLWSYCINTFLPVGLVVKESVDQGGRQNGFQRTEYGERIGVPLVGLHLDFSLRHPDIALRDLYGETISRSPKVQTLETTEGELHYKSRSPITRFKLFWELVTQQLPIREIDLAVALNEKSDILSIHLRQLRKLKLINMDSSGEGEAYSFFRLKNDLPPDTQALPFGTDITLSQKVFKSLKTLPERVWSIDDVTSQIYSKEDPGFTARRARVNIILTHFVKQGILKSVNLTQTEQSRISLDDNQYQILSELVQILDGCQRQDPAVTEEGQALALSIKSSEIAHLMAKAKENSHHVNQESPEIVGENILSIIRKGVSTSPEIREVLAIEYDKDLSDKRIQQLLRYLRDEGKIRGTENTRPIRWAEVI